MNVSKILFLTLAFLFFLPANAQVVCADTHAPLKTVTVLVVAKKTRVEEWIPGALVELMSPKDTLRGYTDSEGGIEFPIDKIGRDSVTVRVTHLGYAEIKELIPYLPGSPLLAVTLTEEAAMLNEVIIKDNIIAMVVHGDTTIYNAAAFQTRKRDPLRKLLEKIPGIKVTDFGIEANGARVGKVLINGTTLFGNNVVAAMNMIYCKDILKVRVFDEYDQDRLVAADTLGGKERVLDVITSRLITKVSTFNVALDGGVFTDKNHDGKTDFLGHGNLRYNKFAVDRPQTLFNVDIAKNYGGIAAIAQEPSYTGQVQFSSMGKRRSDSQYLYSFNADYNSRRKEKMTSNIYSPSELYESRAVDYFDLSRTRIVNLQGASNERFALNDNSLMTVDVSGKYNGLRSDSNLRTVSVQDGENSLTDVYSKNRTNSGSVNGSILYKYIGKTVQRNFFVKGDFRADFGGGNGLRKDDNTESFDPQGLTDSSKVRIVKTSIQTQYNEPAGKYFNFQLQYKLDWESSYSEKLSWNELFTVKQPDEINTYRYTHNDVVNDIFGGVSFFLKEKSFFVMAGAGYRNIWQVRNESLPIVSKYPDNYHHIYPYFLLKYTKNPYNVILTYQEEALTPSIEQRRGAVNNSNPLFLTAGNPSLLLPVSRNLNLDANITSASINTNWSIKARFNEITNDIVHYTTYYSEDTDLPEYGYTALAGSELTKPVNVNGSRSFWGNLESAVYSTPLKSTFTPAVSYNYYRRPFFLSGERYDNEQHSMDFSLSYRSSFSRHFNFNISNITRLGMNLRSGENIYDFLTENVSAGVSFDFLKIVELGVNGTYFTMKTTTGVGNYERSGLDAYIKVYLGEKTTRFVSLSGHDLLGMNNNRNVSVTDYYVSRSYSTILGRYIKLSFSYEF